MQTKGRGRRGKRWESPRGGLWFSILLRPDVPINRLPLFQILAANAIRQVVQDETDVHVHLKWPNDLVTDRGKLGGILVESKTMGDQILFVVIGIGLNVSQPRAQLPAGAVSLLLETGARYDRRKLLKSIVNQTLSRYDEIDEPSAITDEWWQHCVHRQLRVAITTPKGTIVGITRGINQAGALLLETDDGRNQKVNDGTLRVLDLPSDQPCFYTPPEASAGFEARAQCSGSKSSRKNENARNSAAVAKR